VSDFNSFFQEKMAPHGSQSQVMEEIRYAAAALLVVCAKADFEEHPEEFDAITKLLASAFQLGEHEIGELIGYVEEDTGLKRLEEFTNLVNQYYSLEAKEMLIENLWQVAFADGRLDQFEEQYISRVAFMIDIPQRHVAAIKSGLENGEP